MIFCVFSSILKAVVQVSYVLVLFLSIMKNKTSYAFLKFVKLSLTSSPTTMNNVHILKDDSVERRLIKTRT